MKKGKLIVFEGVSGTGKETQARLLGGYLRTKHIDSIIVFHPTLELKDILSSWRKERRIDNVTEVYLLLADRADRVRQIIAPALSKGQWVISLRNSTSAQVYQGTTPELRRWIKGEFSRFEPEPDRLFYFSLSPKQSMLRISQRHKKTGEAIGKFENMRDLETKQRAYREVLRAVPHVPVDASKDIETIHNIIVSSL